MRGLLARIGRLRAPWVLLGLVAAFEAGEGRNVAFMASHACDYYAVGEACRRAIDPGARPKALSSSRDRHEIRSSFLTASRGGSKVPEREQRRSPDLAAAHQIPVFWLVPPFDPRALARREPIGIESRYDRFLRTAIDRYPNLVVVDGRRSGYGPGQFVDATHLDRSGACAPSDDVAAFVDGRLRGERGEKSVALPPYRERRGLEHLEDRARSVEVVRAKGGPERG